LKIDSTEAIHILVSVLTISLAFSLFKNGDLFSPAYFLTVLVTVGAAFICHELAHKYVAMGYGVYAAYRAWTFGLLFAVAMAFATQGQFVFAAPGAVYIFGHVGREKNGKIALAGPAMNLLLCIVFLALAVLVPVLSELAFLGAYVNAFLGGFNMIPVAPLDGQKIMAWDQRIWAVFFVAFLIAFFTLPSLA